VMQIRGAVFVDDGMLKEYIAVDIRANLGMRAYIAPAALATMTVWEFIGFYVEQFAAGVEALVQAERQGKVLGFSE
jgi:hypothetical protein